MKGKFPMMSLASESLEYPPHCKRYIDILNMSYFKLVLIHGYRAKFQIVCTVERKSTVFRSERSYV